MATCPTCKLRDDVVLADTGQDVFIARQLGDHSLSGCQMKVSAHRVRKLDLSCTNCGWHCEVFDAGNGFLYPIGGEIAEAAVADVD